MENETRSQNGFEEHPEVGRKGGLAVGDLGTVLDVQPYRLNFEGAFWSGLVASLAFGALWYLMTLFIPRPEVDISAILGTIVYPELNITTHIVGAAMVLAFGIGGAFLYAALLLVFRFQSTASMGGWYSALLWLGGMIVLPVLVTINPLTRAGVFQTPDLFFSRVAEGWGPATYLLIPYLVYGFLLGSMYRHFVRDSHLGHL